MPKQRKPLGTARPPIARQYVGIERCMPFGLTTKSKVCVYGAKYGFSAWLTTKDGRKLAPISVDARSPREALDQAFRSAKRTVGRNN